MHFAFLQAGACDVSRLCQPKKELTQVIFEVPDDVNYHLRLLFESTACGSMNRAKQL